ncbi:MAG: phosphatase PAP2 family protein [Bacteroidota bacterium]
MSVNDIQKPVEKAKDKVQQAAQAETTSARRRRERTALFEVALIGAITAFAMLTFLVKTSPSLALDLQVTRAVQSIDSPFFSSLMRLVSWPGFPPQSFLFTVLIALLIYSFGLTWEGVAALLTAVFAAAAGNLVKLLIRRPRPTADLVHVFATLHSYSFPSGHVMYYLGFYGFLWFLTFTLLKGSVKRTILLIFFSLPVLLVGLSRIYLGEHWFSDVLGAYLLGSLALAASILFYRWGKKRFFVHQPVAPPEPGERRNP